VKESTAAGIIGLVILFAGGLTFRYAIITDSFWGYAIGGGLLAFSLAVFGASYEMGKDEERKEKSQSSTIYSYCGNCGSKINGMYCTSCGQRAASNISGVCPQCGNEAEDTNYCANCGHKIR